MAEFHFGNKDLAQELGAEVVGDPLTDEIPFAKAADGGTSTIQATSEGVMLYFSELPGKGIPGSVFVPKVRPRS
ncbi:MAG: hypothetical protein M0T85_15655 [Dehalococcoidales bacterium]|nr:hypothetical protein [Dehalococcoidales bacterium]